METNKISMNPGNYNKILFYILKVLYKNNNWIGNNQE